MVAGQVHALRAGAARLMHKPTDPTALPVLMNNIKTMLSSLA